MQAELLGFVPHVMENARSDLLILHLTISNNSFNKYIQRLIKWREENKTWESGISCHIYEEIKINPSFHSYCFYFWKDKEFEYFKRRQIEYLNISAHIKIQSYNSMSTLLQQMWKLIAQKYLWVLLDLIYTLECVHGHLLAPSLQYLCTLMDEICPWAFSSPGWAALALPDFPHRKDACMSHSFKSRYSFSRKIKHQLMLLMQISNSLWLLMQEISTWWHN